MRVNIKSDGEKNVLKGYTLDDKFCIENYDIIDDKSQDESQTLTEFYEKVYLIERELELVIDLMHKTLQ